MSGYMFTPSPGCASLTEGYLHLASPRHKTYFVINQAKELTFD